MKTKVMVELNGLATTVARFRANSDRSNLNCNEHPGNSKSYEKDEITGLGITQVYLGLQNENLQQPLQKALFSWESFYCIWKSKKKKIEKKLCAEI